MAIDEWRTGAVEGTRTGWRSAAAVIVAVGLGLLVVFLILRATGVDPRLAATDPDDIAKAPAFYGGMALFGFGVWGARAGAAFVGAIAARGGPDPYRISPMLVQAGLGKDQHWQVYLPAVVLSFVAMGGLFALERRGHLRAALLGAIGLVLGVQVGLGALSASGAVPSLWVLGSGFGVADGALAFARAAERLPAPPKLVWLASDADELAAAERAGFEAYLKASEEGLRHTLRAGLIVITHGFGDVNTYGADGVFGPRTRAAPPSGVRDNQSTKSSAAPARA